RIAGSCSMTSARVASGAWWIRKRCGVSSKRRCPARGSRWRIPRATASISRCALRRRRSRGSVSWNSTAWSMRPSVTSCPGSTPCSFEPKPRGKVPDERRAGTDRSRGEGEPRRGLHEGHAAVPDVRLLGRDRRGTERDRRAVQGRRRARRGGQARGREGLHELADADRGGAVRANTGGPTTPRVFVGGKFGGGCDIVREMHAKGELAPLLRKAVEPH